MTHTPRIAVCAGSFDPLTNGHVDIITRGARLFDRFVVAVLTNPAKQPWFTLEERMAMMREVLGALPNVEVDTCDGLLVDYVRRRGASAVVRGLRTTSEFVDEWQMAMMNRHLNADFETLFLVSSANAAFISSRLVKEIVGLGGPVDGLVPPTVAAHLIKRPPSTRTSHG